MDIFKAGEGRIKYITLNNDTIKRSADRKVGRAFLYVYIYFFWLSSKTVQYCTNAGRAWLCACTVFVMMYGLDDFQLFNESVLQQAAEIDIGIQSALIEPRRNGQRLFNRPRILR